MEYQLYIDDSGNREYDADRNYTTSGRHRHFVYGAILLTQPNATRLIAQFRKDKQGTFGNPGVEIKSNWLRIPKERKERYLDKWGISDKKLTEFSDGCYDLIRESDLELIGSAVDKLHMQEQYPSPWYAPTAAYETLLQRVVQAVPLGDTVEVTIDDISGKTPKDHEYKDLLRRHHEDLRKTGSRLRPGISFKCLAGPVRFRASHQADMIQLADLVAYCVFRQFRDHPEAWEQAGIDKLPTYEYFGRIAKKFRQGPEGRVQGYGVVKVPLRARVIWTINKKK